MPDCKITKYMTCLLDLRENYLADQIWQLTCGSKSQVLPNIRLGIHFTLGIESNDSFLV